MNVYVPIDAYRLGMKFGLMTQLLHTGLHGSISDKHSISQRSACSRVCTVPGLGSDWLDNVTGDTQLSANNRSNPLEVSLSMVASC